MSVTFTVAIHAARSCLVGPKPTSRKTRTMPRLAGAKSRKLNRLAHSDWHLHLRALTSAQQPSHPNISGRWEQEGTDMKLYYAPGTISLMPHVALLESGLSFVAVRVDEASKKMADGGDYRAINPLGYLPALVLDDGSALLEAAAIAQYIADRNPAAKLAPSPGTIERARLQAWLNFLSSEMHKEVLAHCFTRPWTSGRRMFSASGSGRGSPLSTCICPRVSICWARTTRLPTLACMR